MTGKFIQEENNNMTGTPNNPESWELRSETAKLIALNVAQIYTGLNEGDASINSLSLSFQQLASFCLEIQKMEFDSSDDSKMADIKDIAANISFQVDSAIVAFQFYDRLSQRLGHVQSNLQLMAELLEGDKNDDWHKLRDKIKASYTMEAEHKMHDAVMAGASIDSAIQTFKDDFLKDNEEDIELF